MLQKVIYDNRATLIIMTKRAKYENTEQKLESDVVIRKFFTDTPLDVFRNIMSLNLLCLKFHRRNFRTNKMRILSCWFTEKMIQIQLLIEQIPKEIKNR